MAEQKTVRFLSKNTSSIRKIGESLGNISKSLSLAFSSANQLGQTTNKDNRAKKELIRRDNEFFNRRLQNIRRKDREDVVEASGTRGPSSFLNKNIFRSTKGFLGRILDFLGILLIGWAINTLPGIIKQIGRVIGWIKDAVGIFKGFLDGVFGFFSKIFGAVKELSDKIRGIFFLDEQQKIKSLFSDITIGFTKLGQDLEDEAYKMTDYDAMGMTEAEKMLSKFEGDMGMEKDEDKDEDDKEDDKKDDKKEDDKKEDDKKEDDKKDEKKQDVEGIKTAPKEEDLKKNDTGPDTRGLDGEELTETEKQEQEKALNQSGFNVEGFKEGTSKVKKDGLYNLHKDEAVIPAESVKTYGVEFIERIIANTEQTNITKKKAANQLYRTLLRQIQEEKGFVTEDEAEQLFKETVTKLKDSLNKELPKIESTITEVFKGLKEAEKTIIPELKDIANESKKIIDEKIKTNRLPQTIFIPAIPPSTKSGNQQRSSAPVKKIMETSSSGVNKYFLAVEALTTAYL